MDLRVGLLFQLKRGYSGNDKAERREARLADSVDGSGFVPDSILPIQYFSRSQRRWSAGGEGRLMVAVLEDAICCYLANMNQTARTALLEFHEVNEWFSARNSHDLFAFETICDVLGIDAGWVRRGLLALRAAARVSNAERIQLPRRPRVPNRRTAPTGAEAIALTGVRQD
jgi:hypothetical protein